MKSSIAKINPREILFSRKFVHAKFSTFKVAHVLYLDPDAYVRILKCFYHVNNNNKSSMLCYCQVFTTLEIACGAVFTKLYANFTMEDMAMITILQFLLAITGDWYTLVLTFVVFLFFFPVVYLILVYAVAVFLYAYKSRRRGQFKDKGSWSTHFWNSARLSVCTFINLLAKYWHGEFYFRFLELNNLNKKKTWALDGIWNSYFIDLSTAFNLILYASTHVSKFAFARLFSQSRSSLATKVEILKETTGKAPLSNFRNLLCDFDLQSTFGRFICQICLFNRVISLKSC